jgi:hypothetical protein
VREDNARLLIIEEDKDKLLADCPTAEDIEYSYPKEDSDSEGAGEADEEVEQV